MTQKELQTFIKAYTELNKAFGGDGKEPSQEDIENIIQEVLDSGLPKDDKMESFVRCMRRAERALEARNDIAVLDDFFQMAKEQLESGKFLGDVAHNLAVMLLDLEQSII